MILPKNPSPVSPKGEKLKPPATKSAPADKIEVNIMPFPSGKGQLNTANNHANRG